MTNTGETTDNPETNSQASGPLITVAICTRNHAAFLQRAVESILQQMGGDTELLIIDKVNPPTLNATCAIHLK